MVALGSRVAALGVVSSYLSHLHTVFPTILHSTYLAGGIKWLWVQCVCPHSLLSFFFLLLPFSCVFSSCSISLTVFLSLQIPPTLLNSQFLPVLSRPLVICMEPIGPQYLMAPSAIATASCFQHALASELEERQRKDSKLCQKATGEETIPYRKVSKMLELCWAEEFICFDKIIIIITALT